MQHRLIMALAALLFLGFLSGARAEPPHKRAGGAAKPLLTIHCIPFEGRMMFSGDTVTSIDLISIRNVVPVFVTSPAVAADVSRWLNARAGAAHFVMRRTRL